MENRLRTVEASLVARAVPTRRGGSTDAWDLEARTGILGSARVLGTVEEHGYGRQMVRWRMWPRVPGLVLAAIVCLFLIGWLALLGDATSAAVVLGAAGVVVTGRSILDMGSSLAAIDDAVGE